MQIPLLPAAPPPAPAPYYPGDAATVADLLRHADAFRVAAHALVATGRKKAPSSWAPFRLCAIHAIELYLNAMLQHCGSTPAQIRGLQHNLAARATLAIQKGLVLRKLTAGHLATMHETREYLVTRYGPELGSLMTARNRLTATLDQVAGAVSAWCQSIPSVGPPPAVATRETASAQAL